MAILLDLVLLLFKTILTVVSIVLAVGLFWKMQAIGRAFMANVWWWLNFAPLAYMAMVVTFGYSVAMLERVIVLALAAGYLSIRFFNPLANRPSDDEADDAPDDAPDDPPDDTPDDTRDRQDGITG